MAIKQIALAAMTLAAAAAANAQSSVTIYGVADAFFQYAKADKSVTRLQSGGLNGSRIGFRGTEDLGGGLRAIFTIESGINLDDGTNGQGAMWGRQAFVGLGGNFGTVTLGRQYSSLYFASGDFSAFSNGTYGASTAVIGGLGGYEPVRGSVNSGTGNSGPARVNNSIKYETPSFGGFKVGGLWGFGEADGGNNKTRVADLYARYTSGPIDAMLSFIDDRAAAPTPDLERRTITAGAAYTLGAFRILGGYMKVDDRSTNDVDGDGFWIGGDWRFGSNLLRAQYVANQPDADDRDTQAFGIGYQYDLSKRTAIYSSLTHFKNDGPTRWHSGVPAGNFTDGTDNVNEFVVGVRHSF
ncbi:porin [Eleftheria terrae]|uniref:porin n=1 Tax=Eleftheria terrae TaxID=1597781 RepID=UPI00263B1CD2|nr:porin [Eleftheria terrae]WKB54058.1 porin [Eleftheria terrae]